MSDKPLQPPLTPGIFAMAQKCLFHEHTPRETPSFKQKKCYGCSLGPKTPRSFQCTKRKERRNRWVQLGPHMTETARGYRETTLHPSLLRLIWRQERARLCPFQKISPAVEEWVPRPPASPVRVLHSAEVSRQRRSSRLPQLPLQAVC